MDADGARGDGRREPRSGAEREVAFAAASEVDIAWAAGLFEGEGTIGVNRQRGKPYARLRVASNDVDVLEKFQRVVGCGRVSLKTKATATHGAQYVFSLTRGEQVRDAFMTMYPHLCSRRRERGLEVLAECAKVKGAAHSRAANR